MVVRKTNYPLHHTHSHLKFIKKNSKEKRVFAKLFGVWRCGILSVAHVKVYYIFFSVWAFGEPETKTWKQINCVHLKMNNFSKSQFRRRKKANTTYENDNRVNVRLIRCLIP